MRDHLGHRRKDGFPQISGLRYSHNMFLKIKQPKRLRQGRQVAEPEVTEQKRVCKLDLPTMREKIKKRQMDR
jgi:hypothetical protein